jgi:hypothetical protein
VSAALGNRPTAGSRCAPHPNNFGGFWVLAAIGVKVGYASLAGRRSRLSLVGRVCVARLGHEEK